MKEKAELGTNLVLLRVYEEMIFLFLYVCNSYYMDIMFVTGFAMAII